MIREVYVKTVLNRHKRRDSWFLDDYSLNPYFHCEFNCIYCYIHGSRYGSRVGEGLSVKVNAPVLLERELLRRSRKREYGFIALSSATEPWMWIEEKYEVTRRCLEVIAKYRFPVHSLTKSTLILRDLDLLREIDVNAVLPRGLERIGHGALITFSFSTLDDGIAKFFEPNAPRPSERLKTFEKVKEHGFLAGLAFIPVLPFISDLDTCLEEMVRTAKDSYADYIYIGGLTLYGSGKEAYYRVLDKCFPDLLPRYTEFYRDANQPSLAYQRRLEKRARRLCEKYGVKYMLQPYL